MKCPNCNHEFEEEKPRGEIQKQGMDNKASKGNLMSRPTFGYKIN